MGTKVYVTGMHSGQSPCSGLGIARSIKAAHPDLTIVGVAHWQGSSGFHDPIIDETLVLPIWSQIEDKLLVKDIKTALANGDLWLPALDLEIRWTAENLLQDKGLLSPNRAALTMTEKPEVAAVEELGFRVPDFISASSPDSEIHSFLRHNSWQCWMKSAYHDARRISNWADFERVRDSQVKNWKTNRIYLQRHVYGREETIALSAYQGELLGAVHVDKCLLTPEGKTWAGKVSQVEPELFEKISNVVRRLNWTGGAEIEYVRDPDGAQWVIEWNPRFPAWIYGSTLAGYNLPGRLVAKALGRETLERKTAYPYFTRVVYEVPAKESVGLPLLSDSSFMNWSADGKKGGGAFLAPLPPLSESLDDEEIENSLFADQQLECLPAIFFRDIERVTNDFSGESPARVQLEKWTKHRFDSAARILKQYSSSGPQFKIGYSVKTSPTDGHLREARERGFLAECISQMEVQRALHSGFRTDEIILNGPGKFWPITKEPITGLHMLFCDSVEEYLRVVKMKNIARCVGFRIRMPKLESRFGNSLNEFEEFQRITSAIKELRSGTELGFHFHMPSWAIGVERWMEGFQALLLWCRSIEHLSGRPVRYLDLGGGFYPGDLESMDLAEIQASVADMLPRVNEIYFELGRALTQQSEALISRVLDVRKDPKNKKTLEIVVDASIAELPLARNYPHRVFIRSKPNAQNEIRHLRKGSARILGRICMEDDILCNQIELPNEVEIGDLVVFGDAGAYERSMSYEFGRG